MLSRRMDLFQIIQNKLRAVDMCCRKCSESNDRIHRRADIMRHIIQKGCLRLVRMLRNRKCISQILILFHLTFFFFCHITIRNQDCTQVLILIIFLRHNDHRHPSFIHCPCCKTQCHTFFQSLRHRTHIGKFPIRLLKWLCNNLLYQFFLMCFRNPVTLLIRLHIV